MASSSTLACFAPLVLLILLKSLKVELQTDESFLGTGFVAAGEDDCQGLGRFSNEALDDGIADATKMVGSEMRVGLAAVCVCVCDGDSAGWTEGSVALPPTHSTL